MLLNFSQNILGLLSHSYRRVTFPWLTRSYSTFHQGYSFNLVSFYSFSHSTSTTLSFLFLKCANFSSSYCFWNFISCSHSSFKCSHCSLPCLMHAPTEIFLPQRGLAWPSHLKHPLSASLSIPETTLLFLIALVVT